MITCLNAFEKQELFKDATVALSYSLDTSDGTQDGLVASLVYEDGASYPILRFSKLASGNHIFIISGSNSVI